MAAALGAGTSLSSCTAFDDALIPDAETPDAGAAGAGGVGGTPPQGGTGGAQGGNGAGAGEGGGAPLGHAFLSVDEAMKLCAHVFDAECAMLAPSIRASIGVPVAGPTFSHCVHWLAGPLPDNRIVTTGQRSMLEDMAAARSCAEALGRAHVEKLAEGDPRCQGTARACSVDNEAVIDCSKGERMQIERCGSALLGATVCSANGEPTCSPGQPVALGTYCSGPSLIYSVNGVEERAGCRERGLSCVETAIEFDYCGFDKAKQLCATIGAFECDGQVARLCADRIGTTEDQLWSPFDCAAVGEGVACFDEPALRCERPDAACLVEDGDACSGDLIELCVGGEKVTRSCAAIGRTCGGTPVACR